MEPNPGRERRMKRFLKPRVGQSVRWFAAIGALFAGNIQLGWTPSEPYGATVVVLRAAAQAPIVGPAVQLGVEFLFNVLCDVFPPYVLH
jgi:hypothetical protein